MFTQTSEQGEIAPNVFGETYELLDKLKEGTESRLKSQARRE